MGQCNPEYEGVFLPHKEDVAGGGAGCLGSRAASTLVGVQEKVQ